MMDTGPKWHLRSFNVLDLVVPEKNNFEGLFTIYRRGGHLGHVTKIPQRNIKILSPLAMGAQHAILMVKYIHIYSPGVWTDNPWGPNIIMNLQSFYHSLYILPFNDLKTFPYINAWETKFDLVVK